VHDKNIKNGGFFKMAAVTAAMVKELREMTGAGMMDCKKALANTDGDMDKAVEFLRENGMAKAAKKAGRIAAEGIVKTVIEGNKGAIVEVNSETDFVAKNADFNAYVEDVAKQALNTSASDIDGFLAESWNNEPAKSVADVLASEIAIIGENLKIRRFAQMEEQNGFVASYIHMGGKIGVLVDVETDVDNEAIREMAKNVAMQAAALKPMYTNRDEVDAEYIAKETEIITIAAKNEKPDANDKIIEGMVKGRINKELKEICLLDQVYVKAEDGKQSVSAYVASVAKENNAHITVKGFVRFETGEGLEKKNEDFAAEVAAQLG
jgi:elongation factor Ts